MTLKDGTVGIVGTDGRLRDVVTGNLCGGTAGKRPVERIYASSRYAEKLGAVLDMKDLDLKPEPTLDDLAAYLRPGKKLKVGANIFQQDEERLRPLAGEDGVKYWGWNVQNKHPGAEHKWVFVAVEEVKK